MAGFVLSGPIMKIFRCSGSLTRWSLAILAAAVGLSAQQAPALHPATMKRIGSIDPRFQSYNIEMVEVTGGRFWKPYSSTKAVPVAPRGNQPAGLSPNLFEYRPPIDLSNPRLRKLAAALGPVYVRVSGTWANTTWFQDTDQPAPAKPPAGFNGVLTRKEWKGVIDFIHAVNGKLVTSFAVSPGTRDASGVWTPRQAQALIDYTHSAGGRIAAAEYMNEPNFASIGGAPKGYDAADYGRDVKAFDRFIRKAEPGMIFLGPGSGGEGSGSLGGGMKLQRLASADMLKATGPVFDAFSYHFYGAVSHRCAPPGRPGGTTAAAALTAEWLDRAETTEQFYAGLRDRFEPGKPLWITETAEAACGGDRWASTFLDTFRYLDQHAHMAQKGVKVYMHNTLAASDYGLLDQKSLAPRPDYWAAWLWSRLMGDTVLDPGAAPTPQVRLYAQCLKQHPGGVTLLAMNLDRTAAHAITLPVKAERYTLTAPHLESQTVKLNGKVLRADAAGNVPALTGVPVAAGKVRLAPASITFLAVAGANNASCR